MPDIMLILSCLSQSVDKTSLGRLGRVVEGLFPRARSSAIAPASLPAPSSPTALPHATQTAKARLIYALA
jgi:hypothetical protein